MDSEVSSSARAALEGWPDVGMLERAILLLTVDADRFPHVCILSRAQIAYHGGLFRVAVTSKYTAVNLETERRCTLVVSDGVLLHYIKCVVEAVDKSVEGILGAALSRTYERTDGEGAALQPLQFVVDRDAPKRERWADCASLLSRQEPFPWLMELDSD